jgi:hypothetical protein
VNVRIYAVNGPTFLRTQFHLCTGDYDLDLSAYPKGADGTLIAQREVPDETPNAEFRAWVDETMRAYREKAA